MADKKLKASAKKRGNRLGLWFFKISLRLFGLSGAYGLLYLVCPYYLIFDRPGFSAGMAYINRRYRDHNFLHKIYYVYKLLINQGKNLIDRYYIISGQGQFEIEDQPDERLEALFNDPQRGGILLLAHVGNWQVIMAGLGKLIKKPIYLLMRPEDNVALKDMLDVDGEQELVKIISPEGYLGGVIELTQAISRGHLVSIMGDRTYGADSVEACFLGEKAHFPYAAFGMAAAIGCPVIVLFSAKVSTKKYRIFYPTVIEPRYSSRHNKRQDIEGWIQKFAKNLEDYVAEYPFQWFVFDDIWTENSINNKRL